MQSMDNELKIKWEIKTVKISDLKEWSKNPRKLTKEGYEALIKSIKDFGFHDVLKVDTDGTIISGHQRKKALRELGVEEVKVLFPDRKLTDKEMDIIALKSNRHEGTFDFDMLGNMFEMEDLLEAGFQGFELGFATTKEEDGEDTNTLDKSTETYLGGNVKQITLYFGSEEYDQVVTRLDAIKTELELESHTDVFLKLLEEHENNKG